MNEANQHTFFSRFWRSPVAWVILATASVAVTAGSLHVAGLLDRGVGVAILLIDVIGTSVLLSVSGALYSRRCALPTTQRAEAGQSIKVRIIRGVVQTAGVVVFMSDGVLLVPFWGKEQAVPYSEIVSVQEERVWFGGQLLLRSTGFWLNLREGERVGLAVWNISAEGLRTKLSDNIARACDATQHSAGT